MSNIDKHAVQAVADLKAGYTLGHADVAILNELARIAMASLEAEPAGTFRKGPCGYYPSFHEDAVPLYTAPPAPVSVPAAMEMDDDFDSAFEHGKAVGWNACRAAMLKHSEPFIVTSDHRMMEMPQVEAINAVTAILQGAENAESPTTMKTAPALDSSPKIAESPSGNYPVIQDGWVACSERMPEESGRYWCYVEEQNDLGKSHYQWNCSWNGDRWWVESENGGRVTHWMPLPAAPQQEVKP